MFDAFSKWIGIKFRLNSVQATPPLVSERDVWWVSFGQNIGSEINGKSRLFSRPALILKKLSRNFYLVAPTTTKIKSGTWYVDLYLEAKHMSVCLHQIRTIDYRRLSTRLGQVDSDDFLKVITAFNNLYK